MGHTLKKIPDIIKQLSYDDCEIGLSELMSKVERIVFTIKCRKNEKNEEVRPMVTRRFHLLRKY